MNRVTTNGAGQLLMAWLTISVSQPVISFSISSGLSNKCSDDVWSAYGCRSLSSQRFSRSFSSSASASCPAMSCRRWKAANHRLACSLVLRPQVIRQALAKTMQPRRIDCSDNACKLAGISSIQVTEPNHGWLMQATAGVIGIGSIDQLVPVALKEVELRADSREQ